MSQQEDDLRALAKIMDFLRAVSIILVVMNVYWFCYEAIRLWGVDIGVVDRILMNFNRTAGLFQSILYTKLDAEVVGYHRRAAHDILQGTGQSYRHRTKQQGCRVSGLSGFLAVGT